MTTQNENQPTENSLREDRRIQRTRRLLNEAMLALVVEKPWESISIRDITDRADVNRATFYHHYQAKEDLLTAALEERFSALVASFAPLPVVPVQKFDIELDVRLFRYVEENAELFRALLGEEGLGKTTFRITQLVAEISERMIRAWPQVEMLAYPIEVTSQHLAGSLLGLVRWWLVNDMPYTAEEMGCLSHNLCFHGVGARMEDLDGDCSQPKQTKRTLA